VALNNRDIEMFISRSDIRQKFVDLPRCGIIKIDLATLAA
jgi:hypothetical protein